MTKLRFGLTLPNRGVLSAWKAWTTSCACERRPTTARCSRASESATPCSRSDGRSLVQDRRSSQSGGTSRCLRYVHDPNLRPGLWTGTTRTWTSCAIRRRA
jgi:hypothetical protein